MDQDLMMGTYPGFSICKLRKFNHNYQDIELCGAKYDDNPYY